MSTASYPLMCFIFLCYGIMGSLVGLQYVHYVEHKVKRIKYSSFRFVITIVLLLGFVWMLANVGGFEKRHWFVDFVPVVIMFASILLSSRYLLKRKGISFFGRENS